MIPNREQAGGIDHEAAEPDKPAPGRRRPESRAEPGEPESPREPGPIEGHEHKPGHAAEDEGGEVAHGDTMDGRTCEREVGFAMGDAAEGHQRRDGAWLQADQSRAHRHHRRDGGGHLPAK